MYVIDELFGLTPIEFKTSAVQYFQNYSMLTLYQLDFKTRIFSNLMITIKRTVSIFTYF